MVGSAHAHGAFGGTGAPGNTMPAAALARSIGPKALAGRVPIAGAPGLTGKAPLEGSGAPGYGPRGCGMCSRTGPPSCSCWEDNARDLASWAYVGDGRGGYELVKSFNYVGSGCGSFDKEEVTSYHGCRPRKCCVVAIAVVFVLAAVLATVMLYLRVPEVNSIVNSVVEVLLQTPSSASDQLLLEQSCAAACTLNGESRDCSAHIRSIAGQDYAGNANACRLAHDLVSKECPACTPCPAAAAGCAAPAVPPLASQSASTRLAKTIEQQSATGTMSAILEHAESSTAADLLLGCSSPCTYGKTEATCVERIQWSANHPFASKHNACALGHHLVLQQCPGCAACRLHATGCLEPTTVPYDCTAQFFTWRTSWSPEKQRWCCQHKARGCNARSSPNATVRRRLLLRP